VFGTASRSLLHASGGSADAARAAFVYGADRAFLVAAAFLVATLVLVTAAVRPSRIPGETVDDLELDLELELGSADLASATD
jgi:hypothetical protein